MSKQILMAVLIVISMQGKAIAQHEETDEYKKMQNWSKAEKTFTATVLPNFRDFVYLQNGKMILDMINVQDYQYLNNLDSILIQFRKDIAFYKDSLENGTGNVRIDYVLNAAKEYKQIRFKKYPPEGDIYVNRHGETERLKLEQDTIRILIQNIVGPPKSATFNWSSFIHPIQATIVLNNYTDIDKVIADKAMLHHIIDTLTSVRTARESKNPYKFPSTCIYRPYYVTSDSVLKKYGNKIHFVKYNKIIKREFGQFATYDLPSHHLAAYGNIGAGLVRNTLTPNADLGISYINYYRREYSVSDNWFINIESGSSYDDQMLGVKIRGFSVGAGYLAVEKGNYFKGTTVKVFASVRLMSGIRICPELIATNNFKQVFPGITVKIFGMKREQF